LLCCIATARQTRTVHALPQWQHAHACQWNAPAMERGQPLPSRGAGPIPHPCNVGRFARARVQMLSTSMQQLQDTVLLPIATMPDTRGVRALLLALTLSSIAPRRNLRTRKAMATRCSAAKIGHSRRNNRRDDVVCHASVDEAPTGAPCVTAFATRSDAASETCFSKAALACTKAALTCGTASRSVWTRPHCCCWRPFGTVLPCLRP